VQLREVAPKIIEEINSIARELGRSQSDGLVRIMEVCGTHTHALREQGIPSVLPDNIKLVSGPGCPVCVTPSGYIKNAVKLAREERAVIATFGDMLKVPDPEGTTLSRFTGSGSVRMVYSPTELISLSAETDLPVVFLGIGFETTIPTIGSVFLKAAEMGIKSLYLYTAFKTVIPALKALLADTGSCIDGFMLPGHVSVILGTEAYSLLEEPGGKPGVVTGFEALDMLLGILLILRQLRTGENKVENAYPRAVKPEGNSKARALMDKLLQPRDDLWRGLGKIPGGGLSLREQYSDLDAEKVFEIPDLEDFDPPGCLCGTVIQGKNIPPDCTFFGTRCTPDNPVGPCMVSSEGTCAAYLRYGVS
jgi:hydrogenase expression/formation protein HypD